MIFDMAADLRGNTAGGITWAVAFAAWVSVALLCYVFKTGDTISLKSLFSRASSDASGGSSPKHGAAEKADLVLPKTTNAIFDSESVAGTDITVGGLRLNSAFGVERTSELEMISNPLQASNEVEMQVT